MTSSAGKRPVPPTWAEWSAMHWRERQRTRRNLEAHGLTPPDPPPTLPVELDDKQQRQLIRLSKADGLTVPQYVTKVLARHLAAQAKTAARRRQEAAA